MNVAGVVNKSKEQTPPSRRILLRKREREIRARGRKQGGQVGQGNTELETQVTFPESKPFRIDRPKDPILFCNGSFVRSGGRGAGYTFLDRACGCTAAKPESVCRLNVKAAGKIFSNFTSAKKKRRGLCRY
jgi:hypothetical protein